MLGYRPYRCLLWFGATLAFVAACDGRNSASEKPDTSSDSLPTITTCAEFLDVLSGCGLDAEAIDETRGQCEEMGYAVIPEFQALFLGCTAAIDCAKLQQGASAEDYSVWYDELERCIAVAADNVILNDARSDAVTP